VLALMVVFFVARWLSMQVFPVVSRHPGLALHWTLDGARAGAGVDPGGWSTRFTCSTTRSCIPNSNRMPPSAWLMFPLVIGSGGDLFRLGLVLLRHSPRSAGTAEEAENRQFFDRMVPMAARR
jgi:hypothetical protein